MIRLQRMKWGSCAITCGVALTLCFTLPRQAYGQGAVGAQATTPPQLTLASAIDLALVRNRKLQLAQLTVNGGREQERIAESALYPVLSNQSQVLHITQLQGVVIPPGAFESGSTTGLVPAQTVRIDQGASTGYTSNTALQQPLTQIFRIHAGVQAAHAGLEMTKIQAEDTRNEVVLLVRQMYYQYLIAQMNHVVALDALTAAKATDDENRKAVAEGKLLAATELGSRAEMLDRQRTLLMSRLSQHDVMLQMDDLLGLPIGTELELDPNVPDEIDIVPSRKEALTAVLHASLTVLGAMQDVEKARAGLAAARDAYIPNVSAFAQYNYQSGLPFLEHNFGTFGASFSYDLFDGGAREARVREARLKLSMAQTKLAQNQSDVLIQISAVYDKMEQLQELVTLSQVTLEAREETYRVEVKRGEVNAALASEMATARAAESKAKLDVLTSRLSLLLAQNDVKILLGEIPR